MLVCCNCSRPMEHCIISNFKAAQSFYVGEICESVGTSTILFSKLAENITVLLLNNICLPVHKRVIVLKSQ